MDIFYNAEYVEINNNISINKTFEEDIVADPAIYLKVLSVLIIRAGLFIAEVISIPSSNIQVLVLHNLIDLSITFISYGLIGYIFAFGDDYRSVIGISGFISEDSNFNEFIQGYSILVVVSGLLTAAIGDRISFFAGLIVNFLISSFTFPILFHWILHAKGWMRSMNFAGVKVSYKDYSHSCLIHMAGGFVCFVCMFVLDKRMLRFKDLDSSSIPDIGPNLAFFGYFIMLVGFIGFSIPPQKYFKTHLMYNFYGIILVNMIFAVLGTIITTLLLTFMCPCRDRVSKWANLRFAQGGISGVAMIAGGVEVYSPMAALLAGFINGLAFFAETHIMNKTNMEDYCNISVVHFFSGFLGTLLPPIMGIREGFRTTPYNDFIHFLWQLSCDTVILIYLGIIFCPLLLLFDHCGVLRTLEEDTNHKRAISTLKMIPRPTFKKRLFDWGDNDDSTKQVTSFGRTKSVGHRSEAVNVLYQKNENEKSMKTPNFPNFPNHGKGDANTSEIDHEKHLDTVKHTIMPFFEEMDSDSVVTGSTTAREGGISSESYSKNIEMKIIKNIRKISDSKIFQRLKGKSHASDSESVVSTTTNIYMASTSGEQLETQV